MPSDDKTSTFKCQSTTVSSTVKTPNNPEKNSVEVKDSEEEDEVVAFNVLMETD